MGLDMYLYGSKDEYKQFDYDIGHRVIREEIGYWRKANQIHHWFVENIQDGIDNCAEYHVSKANLTELKNICEEVLENHSLAETLLPSQEGFFFGETDYDEYYFQDLEDTIQSCNWALSHKYDYFTYESSW